MEEPSKPDALALSFCAHPVHAVVPVSPTDQRQTMGANRKTPVKGPRAVFEESLIFLGNHGLKVGFLLAVTKARPFEKWNFLIENTEIISDPICGRHVRQPDSIIETRVRTLRPMAAATSAEHRPQ